MPKPTPLAKVENFRHPELKKFNFSNLLDAYKNELLHV